MNLSDINTTLIVDFDSTFVKLEGLEELAKIALQGNPRKHEIIKEIEDVTNDGMSGRMSFESSLEKRLKLFQANESNINNLITLLDANITDSILRNKDFFNINANNIYIISGGFENWILPIVKPFGIPSDHVLSNKFIFDNDKNIIGIDTNIPLCKSGGKSLCVNSLNIKSRKYIIGDGFTDYEIKRSGEADIFVLFTENIQREELIPFSDNLASSWDDLLKILNLK